jgi:hypothetical protein
MCLESVAGPDPTTVFLTGFTLWNTGFRNFIMGMKILQQMEDMFLRRSYSTGLTRLTGFLGKESVAADAFNL